jgi:cytochrome c biogenesis protein CcmG/thiol:disulfide interchange protein DsbE
MDWQAACFRGLDFRGAGVDGGRMLSFLRWVGIFIFSCGAVFAAEAQKVDARSNEILTAIGAQLAGAKTAEVGLHLAVKTPTAPKGEGDLAADYLLSIERPNRMALVVKEGNMGATVVCDGTNTVTFIPKPGIYTVEKAPNTIAGPESSGPTGDLGSMAFITALFSENPRAALLAGVLEAKYAGREKVGATDCERIDMKQEGLDWRLFATTGEKPLVRRIEVTIPQLSMSMDFTGWKLNEAIPRDRFVFAPPPGAKKVAKLLDEDEKEGEDSDLVGETVPKLKLKTVEGGTFDTATLKGKVWILVIWAGEAEHCASAIQAASELAAARKDVGIATINVDEKPDVGRIKAFLGKKASIKTAVDQDGQAVEKFEVEGVPLTFLIDNGGVIRKAFLGYHKDFKAMVGKEIEGMVLGGGIANGRTAGEKN